jgi:RNA polymerase sigma-70 factor (ECF subfamily)
VAHPPDWAELYLHHRDAMQKVAASVLLPTGRPDLAEDAVMQAILSLLVHQPPVICNPEALLVATAKRKAIDLARTCDLTRRCRRELHPDDLHDDGIEADTVDRIDRHRATLHVLAEIAGLPKLQRQVITSIFIHGQPARQVATELGLSPARVSQLRAAALATLRSKVTNEPAR